jgi:two-component system chemotaxis response regulator CheB
MNTRVLVVDDTALFRRVISDALAAVPGVEVVGTASNGKLALARLASLQPDLITLDIEMPEMNGIEVLQSMASSGSKAGAIMLSSNTVRGGQITIRALELGAFDFITKPEGGSPEENRELLRGRLGPIIRAFERRREIRSILENKPSKPGAAAIPVLAPHSAAPRTSASLARKSKFSMVLIGVSTGGPVALAEVLPALPRNLGVPVFIVQHMPPHFTLALAERLQSKSAIRVKEAEEGEIAVPDCAYIAPGGRHMKLVPGAAGEIVVQLTDDSPENNCRPSVDYLFRSAALHFPGRSVAVILTGMGNDGTQGLRLLKRSACSSIAQDEASCVVFGMPKEAILAGVVDTVVPLIRVADAIVHSLSGVRT